MTFISFPIAHSPHPVNHPSYVFPITLLILQNDTPDIASPPTYYATRTTLRLPETFALLPHLPPSTFGTKVPCLPIQPMHPVLMCSTSYPVLRWRDARACDAGARKQGSQAHVDSPSPLLTFSPSFPYSSVSRETCEDHPRAQLRERARHAPGLSSSSLRSAAVSVLAALALRPGAHGDELLSTTRASEDDPAPPFPTHMFHVKPMSIVHSPARPPRAPVVPAQ